MHSQELQRQLKKSREQGQASSKLMEQLKQKEHQTDVLQEKISHVQASLKECRDELGRKSLRLKELQACMKFASSCCSLYKQCDAVMMPVCALFRGESNKMQQLTKICKKSVKRIK